MKAVLLPALIAFVTGCHTQVYRSATYNMPDDVVSKKQFSKISSLNLSCTKKQGAKTYRDTKMCNHIKTVIGGLDPKITIHDAPSRTAPTSDSRSLSIEVSTQLGWADGSSWSYLMNIVTYGCSPYEKQRWYQTTLTTKQGGHIIDRRSFKAEASEYVSWCYYLFDQSHASEMRGSADHQQDNINHFNSLIYNVMSDLKRPQTARLD